MSFYNASFRFLPLFIDTQMTHTFLMKKSAGNGIQAGKDRLTNQQKVASDSHFWQIQYSLYGKFAYGIPDALNLFSSAFSRIYSLFATCIFIDYEIWQRSGFRRMDCTTIRSPLKLLPNEHDRTAQQER